MKGRDAFLYILFEHQSTPDPMMVFRLLCCMVNIWKEWLDQNPDAKCLPVIFPAVLYHGKKKWKSPRTMGGMIQGGEEFSEHLPDFTVNSMTEEISDGDECSVRMALGTVLYLFKHIFDKEAEDIFAKCR
ncbi:MAG: Rpn family recombination-promoting nuclease/putative transposase [Desulfobacterales bacterium]